MVLNTLCRPVLMTLGGILLLFRVNNSFGSIFVVFVVIQLALMAVFILKTIPIFSRVQRIIDRLNERIQETLHNLRLIKVQLAEKEEQEKFGKVSRSLYEDNKKIFTLMSLFDPIMMLMINTVIILIIVILGLRAQNDPDIIGNIMMVITYTEQILMAIASISSLSQSFSEVVPSYHRLQELLHAELPAVSEETLPEHPGNLQAREVSFGYLPGRSVLQDVSIELAAGEIVAVTGGSGNGHGEPRQLRTARVCPAERAPAPGGREQYGGFRVLRHAAREHLPRPQRHHP